MINVVAGLKIAELGLAGLASAAALAGKAVQVKQTIDENNKAKEKKEDK